MSQLQTFLALVVLIYVLCVIVQAVQEIVKWALSMKATTMKGVIEKFMGELLTVDQVETALKNRGLDITALEHYSKDDFHSLLNTIPFTEQQIQQIPNLLGIQNTTLDQFKEHAAAAYDAAMAKFQQSYTKNNKMWVIGLSFIVVLVLNASVIQIYEVLAVDQTMSQAIAGTASTIANQSAASQPAGSNCPAGAETYCKNRDAISAYLKQDPVLFRTLEYPKLTADQIPLEILGLVLMGVLVSLGAPFWNDVLKGINGVNSALNSGGKKAS